MATPTVAEVIEAAKAAQAARRQDIPMWGLTLTVAPASATEFAHVKRTIASEEAMGKPQDESEIVESAWVRACVKAPVFDALQCLELRAAAPADFSNLANLCRMISRGESLPLLMLNIWAAQADNMQGEVEAGHMPGGILAFWTTLVRCFVWWLRSDEGKALDWRALGKDLAGLEEGAGIEEAAGALEAWAEHEGVEAKNEQGAESLPSSAPASSGPDEAPTSLPSPDGPGDSSTNSSPSTP